MTVVTQNVDGLHARAGTKNLVELHGNLYKTRCTKCKEVIVNNENPICEVINIIIYQPTSCSLKLYLNSGAT